MLLGLLILSIGIVVLIVYFAFSKKSSRQIKHISIIALIIVVLSVLVSVVIYVLYSQPALVIGDAPVDEPVIVEMPEPVRENDIVLGIVLLGMFSLLLFIIVYNALKEQKRQKLEAERLQKQFPSIKNKED